MAQYQTCEGCQSQVPESDIETHNGQELCGQCAYAAGKL